MTNTLLTNCVFSGNSATNAGGAYSGTLINCTLLGNWTPGSGGGAQSAVLINSTLKGNSAYIGGGVSGGTLSNCTLSGNVAERGGGADSATLNNCALTSNSAKVSVIYSTGGGAYGGILNNCTLSGNTSFTSGAGASVAALNGCTLTGNSAATYGGGVINSTVTNCTLTGNSAGIGGGGAYGGTQNDCILYYNTAPTGSNYYTEAFNYCCTTPAPNGGMGNITLEPQLVSVSHLSATSPCRGAGSAAYSTGLDIDGEPWLNPPSIGCDEYHDGAVLGPLEVVIGASWPKLTVGFATGLTAWINGQVSAMVWDFGDGTTLSNRFYQPYAIHAWAVPGDYSVVLRVYDDQYSAGLSATVAVQVVAQAIYYVAAGSTNPVPPYTSWETAAGTIQDAVDAADASVRGALVLVTNGVYATGGRAVYGLMTNRVAVARPVVVKSVNGPEVTVIQDYQVPGTTNGDGAIRCVYLTNGAVLSGFTLTNGATRSSGDSGLEQAGGGVWCEFSGALVTNCTLTANAAYSYAGGAYYGTLNNCNLTGNSALSTVAAPLAGGAFYATLNNCTLAGNSAQSGGGAYYGILNNCTLTGNTASGYGGGACSSALNNCAIFGNTARVEGGGVDGGTLNNCTLTGNSVTIPASFHYGGYGGGASFATLNNCILYYNTTANLGPNYYNCTVNYCCTTPDPGSGTGNITAEPLLASTSHLSATSPCRGAGSAAYSTGVDIDGEPWLNPPSIGCDEYQDGAFTGDLTVAIGASESYVKVGFVVNFTGTSIGRVSASMWDLGDGIILSNQPYASRSWDAPGDHTVLFRAYNDSHPEGVSAAMRITVMTQPVHYVLPTSSNPSPPYRSWETAARTIQDAVDIANAGAIILVTNGVYATGGRGVGYALTNRVAVTKTLLIQSVNGPQATLIQGYQVPGMTNGNGAIRCVYLANGAVLSGFTLTNGATSHGPVTLVSEHSGGGVFSESTNALVTNCILTANSATRNGGGAFGCTLINCSLSGNFGAGFGGGAGSATLINCALNGNSAYYGGAAYGGTLNNCTLTGNAARYGGGAYGGTLNNCILCYNTAPNGSDYYSSSILNSCFTADPLFVDRLNGNLRLQSNSPCINAGNNAYVSSSTDLDGRPRIVGGTVDIGAYEFQPSVPGAFIGWLQGYGLPTDGSADFADPDHDNLNNFQEWTADTNPTNAISWLRVESISPGPPVTVSLQTSSARLYTLQFCTDMANPQWLPVSTATDIPGTGGPLTLTDSAAAATAPRFYRVSVRLP